MRLNSPGLLFGPHPHCPGDVRKLAQSGVTSVVNLQHPMFEGHEIDDQKCWMAQKSLHFHHLPLSMIKPPSSGELVERVELLERLLTGDLKSGNVYLNCHDGLDRSGAVLWAFNVWVLGHSVEQAAHRMISNGFHTWRYFWWIPFLQRHIEKGRR